MGSLVERVAKAVTDFTGQLSSAHAGALSQVWLPEVDEDGAIVLNTQGLPYAINGTGDLLALFRCISCKYKFATDLTKPHLMGAVGRVFTSGEPEMSHNVQQYDRSVFLRVAEAQRCRISSALFMPLYNSPKRDCVLGVYEVVQTQGEVLFPAVVDWLRCCLHEAGLYSADVDKHAFTMGLRPMPPEYNVSAFESGTAAVLQRHQQQQQQQQAAVEAWRAGASTPAGAGAVGAPAGVMLPPPPPLALGQPGEQPPSTMAAAAAAAVLAAAGRVAAGAPAQAAAAAQLLPPAPHAAGEAQQLESRDERGDTLMGSSGPGANPAHAGRMGITVSVPSAKRTRASSEPPPSREQELEQEQEQQQPKAKPPDAKAQQPPQQQQQPATAAVQQQQQPLGRPGGPALAGEEEEEDDGEDEVMQPAKPLPPPEEAGPQQHCSGGGAHVESSGMPLSGEGAQARTPQEGSGRGSNTQEKRQAGSSNPPSGLPAAPSYPFAQPAGFAAGTGMQVGEAGSPAAAPAAANGRASDVSSPNGTAAPAACAVGAEGSRRVQEAVLPKLEKVGTAGQLSDMEQLRQQKLLAAGRSGSAPPTAAWLGAHGLGSGDLATAAAAIPSPRQEQQAKAGGQLSSAEPTTINQPMAAALAALLVQQQQGTVTSSVAMPALLAQQAAAAAAAAPGLAGQQPLGRPPPAMQPQPQLLASAAAAASLLRSPSIPGSAAGLPPRAGQPTVLPGGVLTVLPPPAQPQLFGAAGNAGGSAADLARLGSGALARMGSGGVGAPAEMARIGSGGVGQKNLTLEDLKPHFGYGLKEAAARLGICPTTLKRTCRRLGISRWPRRQLVRLTKQHLGAAGKPEDLIGNRPPSTSDGSGSGDQPPVQMALRAPGQAGALLGLSPGAGAAQAGGLGQASPAGASPAPGLLLALQQIQAAQQAQQQQAGAGEAVREDGGGALPPSLAATSPSLHQQLLQLQQQAGAGGPGGPAGRRVSPEHLMLLQQLTAAAGGAGAQQQQQQQRQSPGGPGPAGLGPGSGPPLFLRGQPGARPSFAGSDAQQGGSLHLLRPGGAGPPEAPWDLQQHLAAVQGLKEEDAPGGGLGLPQLLANGNGHASPMLEQQQQRQPLGNEPASGPYTGMWPLSARPGSTLPTPPNGSQQPGTGVGELSRAAAVAALHLHRVGGPGGAGGSGLGHLLPRRGNSPTPPLPNGLSLGSMPRLGGDHPAESLDILAAADFDSVVNSPPGISHLGGLSNLGLSNLGVSNLDLPGVAGLEFSVGAYPGATSSQRP